MPTSPLWPSNPAANGSPPTATTPASPACVGGLRWSEWKNRRSDGGIGTCPNRGSAAGKRGFGDECRICCARVPHERAGGCRCMAGLEGDRFTLSVAGVPPCPVHVIVTEQLSPESH